MIALDHVIVLQAVLSGGIVWCACQERAHLFYRAGFVLLACSSGFMVWRRVTARADLYLHLDRIVLPTLITYIMAAATICFILQHVFRGREIDSVTHLPTARARVCAILPFALFLAATSADFLPTTSPEWDGRGVSGLQPEQVRHAALFGPNEPAAIEQLRFIIDTDIDTLRLAAFGNGPGAEFARRKLIALSQKLEAIRPAAEQANKARELK